MIKSIYSLVQWGLAKNENPNQGAFIIDELTDLVEEAVLKEFEAIPERGGDLLCELRGDRVVIAGQVVEYLRGEIETEGPAI